MNFHELHELPLHCYCFHRCRKSSILFIFDTSPSPVLLSPSFISLIYIILQLLHFLHLPYLFILFCLFHCLCLLVLFSSISSLIHPSHLFHRLPLLVLFHLFSEIILLPLIFPLLARRSETRQTGALGQVKHCLLLLLILICPLLLLICLLHLIFSSGFSFCSQVGGKEVGRV